MSKSTFGVLCVFAFLSTGCCLRVMNTRIGVDCCGTKDSETFVADEDAEGTASATGETKTTGINPADGTEMFLGIAIAAGVLGVIGWNVYKVAREKKANAPVEQPSNSSQK